MADVNVLEILLYNEPIGTLTQVQGDRSIFAFNEDYIEDGARPTLSLSFKDSLGELITDFKPVQTRIMPFFSNMLPEGAMRDYLAERANVKPQREFFLLWVLGQDLPGAVKIQPIDGESLPQDDDENTGDEKEKNDSQALRFSLAGVQLKFSAVMEATGGLTIPTKGIGGSWIVKLPSTKFEGVAENEYSMMKLANMIGIDIPDVALKSLSDVSGLPSGIETLKGSVLIIKRFDRTDEGEQIHIEDFAQVFGVYPGDKYKKASYKNIAEILAIETNEDDVTEFIRRLIFNTLIGNADMHLKNWSLIYPDKKHAALAPGYDFVSTINFLEDEKAALNYARTKRMDQLTEDELAYMASKALLPEKLVINSAKETIAVFHDVWGKEKNNLSLDKRAIKTIDKHISKLPIAKLN